ncbi:GNAT family N-acetyltransferase [Prosthecomicrobium hirschii]|uniref:GNAT family N-acetyltransferase n=1 Tax=Prosthecodimorpha hirschii TaxID=665126 RepID=UPI00112AAE3B|nr:GNAT family N-acetyltransferase [Prosthecomicrobium hirschii]TPQ52252.1 GNAT family N-acetyltransferase [Prosthecomicrobium hirschii]
MILPPEPLNADHDLSAFDCGKPALNEWLRTYALANQIKGFTRVMVVREGVRVIGFYGLAPTAVPPSILSRKLRTGRPPDPVPCILFGQLAVDTAHVGRGLGSALLRHALERCVAAAETIGGRAVIVRAIDGEAEAFWQSCGFIPSSSDASTLFRSIDDIAAWLVQSLPVGGK